MDPHARRSDLVVCLYVHVAGSVDEMGQRVADGVTVGGALSLAGHRPSDPTTGAATIAAGKMQVAAEDAVAAFRPCCRELIIAEEGRRPPAEIAVDAVVRARRLS